MAGLADITVSNYLKVYYDVAGIDTEITNIQSFTHPTDEKNVIEVAQFGSDYPRKLTGSSSTGNAELVLNFNPSDASHQYLLAAYKSGAKQTFKVEVNSDVAGTKSSYYEFEGQVASKSVSGDFDTVTTITFSLSVDGAIGDWTAGA